MHAGSWESTREAFEWHEAKPKVVVYKVFAGEWRTVCLNSLDLSAFLQHHCSCKYVFELHFFLNQWTILSTFRSQNY